jgi:hypothetical protein
MCFGERVLVVWDLVRCCGCEVLREDIVWRWIVRSIAAK